jgi:hypothetical protein
MARPAQLAAPVTAPGGGRRRWLILEVIAIARLIVVLEATIVNIALRLGAAGRT